MKVICERKGMCSSDQTVQRKYGVLNTFVLRDKKFGDWQGFPADCGYHSERLCLSLCSHLKDRLDITPLGLSVV